MPVVRVTTTTVYEVDTDGWLKVAGTENTRQLSGASYTQIARRAVTVGYAPAGSAYPTDGIPRWARDTVQVISHSAEVTNALTEG